MHDVGIPPTLQNNPNIVDRLDKFGPKDAEMEVEAAQAEEIEAENRDQRRRNSSDVTMEDSNASVSDSQPKNAQPQPQPQVDRRNSQDRPPPPSIGFTFSFPAIPSSSSNDKMDVDQRPTQPAQPIRRRSGAPTAIPDFPKPNELRGKEANPFSPSPSGSPKPSPFRTPLSPNTPPGQPSSSNPMGFALPAQPFLTPSGSSPWLALAETSGAPTPSLHGPGRSSPHLGGPFEQLNIGNSWSGSNLLWAEGAQGRRGSLDRHSGLGVGPHVTPTKKTSGPAGLAGGMSSETLARYRAMAGKASASGAKGKGKDDSMSSSDMSSTTSLGSSPTNKPPLPAALAKRRASLPKSMLEHLTPGGSLHVTKSPSPLASEAASSSSTNSSPEPIKLKPITAKSAKPLLPKPSTLILDLRPPSAFQSSHIPLAHSLPIPSTLLRRPNFNLDKLVGMLAPLDGEAVSKWKTMQDIVILDSESITAPEGSILEGLASKFERGGYRGHLWFIKGGHSAAATVGIQMTSEEMSGDVSGSDAGEAMSAPLLSISAPSGLIGGRLGRLAFQQGSTGGGASGVTVTSGGSSKNPSMDNLIAQTPGLSLRTDPFANLSSTNSNTSTERPFGSTQGQHGSQSSLAGSSIKSPGSSNSGRGGQSNKIQPANPFFDNIRQNLELSHGGITERIPLQLPQEVKRRAHELPEWLAELVEMPDKDGADKLALQFYEIELGEQKRLQSVMDWHTKGSGKMIGNVTSPSQEKWVELQHKDQEEMTWLGNESSDSSVPNNVEFAQNTNVNSKETTEEEEIGESGETGEYFPFSITAGVEMGAKNRYKNIWPYDFSRVKLNTPEDKDSDYINASFIQPRGTSRRYIATQGPLNATYRDFWTLIWEQDVRVIVMLTKQFEGGLLKCGNYWGDQQYGNLKLTMIGHTGGNDEAHGGQSTGFDFGPAASTPQASDTSKVPENIRRTFLLSHDKYRDQPPRKVVQLQCIAWPDFDVPESPDVLLSLIKDTDKAMKEVKPDIIDRANCPPVLVHCSAGVGRTGSFIIVDAILDGLRREHNVNLNDKNDYLIDEFDKGPRVSTTSSNQYFQGQGQLRSPRKGFQLDGSPFSVDDTTDRSRSGSGLSSRKSGSPDNLGSSLDRQYNAAATTRKKNAAFAHEIVERGGRGHSAGLSAASGGSVEEGGRAFPTKSVTFDVPEKSTSLPIPVDRSRSSGGTATAPKITPAGGSHPVLSTSLSPLPQFSSNPFSTSPSPNPSGFPVSTPTPSEPLTRTDSMDVDTPPDGVDSREQAPGDYTKHRGGSTSVYSSEYDQGDAQRRPSLVSVFNSSERLSNERIPIMPTPVALTKSSNRHRSPSPLSEMDNPVQAVLEGMRVQRMSLVQSLRQFVFVHRAIIHNYLSMIDEDSERDATKESTADSSDIPTSGASINTEDEAALKRRASPTELSQEREKEPPGAYTPDVKDILMKDRDSNISRRPSVKRMKPTAEEVQRGASSLSGGASGSGSGSTSATPRRRGSKVSLESK